jgi:uncharacterized protein YjbJ (UPF0337 family)
MLEPDALPDTSSIHGSIQSIYFTNGRQGVVSGLLEGGIPKAKGWGWRMQGTLKDVAGKIQEEAGKWVGSKKQQAKGLKKQAEGKIQKGVGNLKQAVSDVRDAARK